MDELDESELFFKALPENGLIRKFRSCKVSKKSKKHFTAAFFVAADDSKCQSQLLFGKSSHQHVLRAYRTKLD